MDKKSVLTPEEILKCIQASSKFEGLDPSIKSDEICKLYASGEITAEQAINMVKDKNWSSVSDDILKKNTEAYSELANISQNELEYKVIHQMVTVVIDKFTGQIHSVTDGHTKHLWESDEVLIVEIHHGEQKLIMGMLMDFIECGVFKIKMMSNILNPE